MTDRDLHRVYTEMADRFAERFPEALAGPRTIGREAEFPLVTPSGAAADLRELWPYLAAEGDLRPQYDAINRDLIVALDGPDYNYSLEVGLGTAEINTRPCTNLFELQAIHDRALGRLVEAAHALGWRVLGYGVQPLTPPTPALMAPKQRYGALLEAMGEEWLWYTVTASDQTQISIVRPELVRMLNYGCLITPVIVAFCANSPVYAGALSPFSSAREGEMAHMRVHGMRHALPLRSYRHLVEFVENLAQYPFLVRRAGDALVPDNRPFVDYLREQGPDFDAFLLHDHYIWHSARLRAAYGTLELRPACQQPAHESMAATALCVGLVEAMESIERYITRSLGRNYWRRMRRYHRAVILEGLAASEPAADFLGEILHRVTRALERRGYGEHRLLSPLWERLNRRQNPAQQMRGVFRREGMAGLLRHAAVPADG